MNKMDKTLRELFEMDELAAGDSPLHRLHPSAKLLAAVAFIVTAASFHKYDLSGLLPMLLVPVVLFQAGGIPVGACFYKLRVVLPLVLAVGLFNPLLDRTPLLRLGMLTVSGGVVSMLTLMLKGVLCLMMAFLLMATTSIDRLCAALRRMHLPALPVTLLLLTYRYVGVLMRELSVMTDAYRLRAPGQRGVHFSAWGSFLGQLLLRSADRAQELYGSMQLRGWDGRFYYAELPPFRAADAAFLLGSLALFLLLRLVPAARLLGSLVVR